RIIDIKHGRRTGQGSASPRSGGCRWDAAPKRVLCGLLYGLGTLAITAMIVSIGLVHRRISGSPPNNAVPPDRRPYFNGSRASFKISEVCVANVDRLAPSDHCIVEQIALPGFISTISPSDSHRSRRPKSASRPLPSLRWVSPVSRITFQTCRAHYPGGSNECICRLLPHPCGLPR